jgi:acyl carrier protein
MRCFLAIAVSVKIRMMIWIKRDSLFFKGRCNYKWASKWPISASPGQAMAYRRDRWKLKMQSFNADVQGRLLALVKAILEQNSITAQVDPESRLVDVGLTSMDMVNLMLSVEAEFDFTIPQSEITPENFQSIETLQRMVVGQLQPEHAA